MSEELEKILNELLLLVYESEEYHGASEDGVHQTFRGILAEVRKMLADIRRRVVASFDRYVVAVVGLTNVGKSTLLNALFGQDLAPRRMGPCTAAPIEFTYGDEYKVLAYHFVESFKKTTWLCPDIGLGHRRKSGHH